MPLNALQMPIYALTDVTGLVEWIDYIPAQVETAGRAGSTDDDGYLQSANVLSDNTGLVAWVDYIPVYEVTGRTQPWYVGSDGYIPYNEIGSVVAWTPASLFASGEVGAWYDPSDLTTMWTDDGTTQAGVGDLVYRIDDKSGNGNHARQATLASRPILRQDGSGHYYLEFDGTDDGLNSASNVPVGEETYIIGAANILAAGGGATSWPLLGVGAYTSTGSFGCYCRNDVVRRINGGMRAGSSTTYTTPNLENAYTRSTPFIFHARHESNTLYADTNVATEVSISADDNTDATVRVILISWTGSGVGLNMAWYGGVFVRRTLSSGDKDSAWAYFADKAGVTL